MSHEFRKRLEHTLKLCESTYPGIYAPAVVDGGEMLELVALAPCLVELLLDQ